MGSERTKRSQSPQTGQFNSYLSQERRVEAISFRLNPLKRVNSILTMIAKGWKIGLRSDGLNPLKRVNSILTVSPSLLKKSGYNRFESLNPLKRVNSILTSL